MSQLDLFRSPEPETVKPVVPERPAAEPVYTLHQVVGDFLKGRQAKAQTPLACRNCRCTEASPCKLFDGDTCTLDHSTGYCSAPCCVVYGVRRAS